MADRVTKVTLTAQVAQYVAGMEKAAKATKDTGSAAEKLAQQKASFEKVGQAALAVGALAAAGVGLAVAKFAEFDKAMSSVQAATHESSENMGLLRAAALDFGASTAYTATEAAGAIEELSKAGLTTADILSGGLAGALDLAAAGELGVAEAAEIASIALKQFNLAGADVPHVADLLAAGAGKAVGSVGDLSAALNQVGLVANGAGHSIEDTTGVLAAFADAGLLGSDAGTSLKAALIALQAPTDKARDVMEKYNLSFYDANGKMRSFDEIAGQLKTKLGGLTDETRNAALAQIFGNDALRVANVLYDEGADGIRKYITQTNDAGYAAETARIRMDNLAGDVEKLGGAFDTAFIKTGSGANDSLRTLVQGVTGLVDAVGSLPEPVLGLGLAAGGIVAAVGLVGGAALLAVPKIAEFKAALTTLNVSGAGVARGLGGVTGALVVAGAAFAVFAERQADATGVASQLESTLDAQTGAITDNTRALVAKELADRGVFEAGKMVGLSSKEITDAVLEQGSALDEVKAKFAGQNNIVDFFNGSGIAAGNAGRQLDILADGVPRARQNLEDQASAADVSAQSTEDAATAYQNAADKAGELESNLRDLIDAVNEANGVGQDAVSSNAKYQEALAGITGEVDRQKEAFIQLQRDAYEEANGTLEGFVGTLDGFTLSLDQSTASGSANAAMLSGVAADAQKAAEAQYAVDLTTMSAKEATDKFIGTLATSRQAMIDGATEAGYNADEVHKLADEVFALPDQAAIDIIANTAEAQRRLDAIASSVASFQGSGLNVTAYVRQNADGGMYAYADGGVQEYASGGFASGIYSGRSGGIHKFAEPETRWEAYVSGKPGQEARNKAILWEAGDRLGMWNSSGGGGGAQASAAPAQAFPAVGIQLLRDIANRVGVTIPAGALQGPLGASNVSVSTRGRA